MILVIAASHDVHARHIANLLEKRGHRVGWLSRADFATGASIALQPLARNGTITLRDGKTIGTSEISVAWCRRLGNLRLDPAMSDEFDRSFAENEWERTIDAFFTLALRRTVSPPLKQRAAIKPVQLSLASDVGLRVPDTLITNDVGQARAFVDKHKGAVVHKAITTPPHRFLDTCCWDAHAAKRIGDLPLCPTIFQEQIFGPADIRATVIGKEVFAACIHTARGQAGIDSRLDADVPCEPYTLPQDVEAAILALMHELGLVFGTVDLKLSEEGEHIFLEVNPQGQFLYIEILTGLPISNALADFLAAD